MTIHTLNDHLTIELAAQELARCLQAMTGSGLSIRQSTHIGDASGFFIGYGAALRGAVELPEVADPQWDDGYCIRSRGEGLVIGGVNARSALMGAYHYLRLLGAEWLWPGDDGEVLPHLETIPLAGFDICEVPANRHRGVCIEGAPALEHVLDMVEWLPRVGLNSYFLQFQVASYFWRLWYGHDYNPDWPDRRDLTEDECTELDERVMEEVKRRGLLLHQVGHGWTAAALGLPTNGWVKYQGELSDEQRSLIALVNGKREVHGGIPINTELCYSNPRARQLLVNVVLGYARTHPHVDALHFWLSDAPNNLCECEQCAALSPADWYVMLLNEITPMLKAIAPYMKLVFLAYMDTLWPPEKLELDLSRGNLIYMFAPISRCYAHHLADSDCGEDRLIEKPPLNTIIMPRDNRDNVQLLRLWDKVRPRDSFVFDYQFMWIWREDRVTVRLDELMPADIADYRASGMGGLMNCCTQRIFYPTGWPFYTMAHALWGRTVDEALKARYFGLAYGAQAAVARGFLDGYAAVTGSPTHGRSWWDTDAAADGGRAERVLCWLAEKSGALAAGLAAAQTPTERRAWKLLVHYRDLHELLWRGLEAKLGGDAGAALSCLDEVYTLLNRAEAQTAAALDGYLMRQYLDQLRAKLTN